MQLLRELVNSKRLTLSKTAKEAQNPEDATDIQHDRLVSKQLDVNRQLSQQLIAATEEQHPVPAEYSGQKLARSRSAGGT